ncbi:MAG: efflux RND transporter permease subunit [Candidatus Coatesbacteria bacterium]|nr:efflux RND transporter permease subunit [Candidatus Coatesbacteria bacterium]
MEMNNSGAKRGPIAYLAGHSVAANLIMMICLVGGFLALMTMKQEVFPDVTMDQVIVSVSYPGASPEEVEEGIILSIEEAVRGLDGVDEFSSTANEGSGTVTIDLLIGADDKTVAQDVQSEIDRITTFPEDAEEPSVRIAGHKHEVLDLIIYGDVSDVVLHQLSEQLRDYVLQHPNVTQVEIEGLPSLEISIEVSQENLRRYGLTLADVAQRLANESLDVPGGSLKTDTGEILVRVKERRDYGKEFAQIPIITAEDGSQVLLGQIATIDDGFEDTDRYMRYNGVPAMTLEVYRIGDQTPADVANAVREQVEEFQPHLPPGIHTAIERDRSEVYVQRVDLLLKNAGIGLILVLILLGLFLEARLAFWVMMGIPISFLGSFLFLPMSDISINMMSLFAYIIALGIVVDDAIVVGENVYHYRQEGLSPLKAAIKGAREVAMPVTFSILTNIVTFLPIYIIPGTTGKFFKTIPVVVSIVFLISLAESLFVLPSHLGHQKDRRRRGGITGWLHERQQRFSAAFRSWVKNRYGPFLTFVLHHRYITVAISLAILVISLSYALSGRMGFQLFPIVERDFSQASVVMPYGTPPEKTEAVLSKILAGAKKVISESGHPELEKSTQTDIGRGGSHNGRVRVELADPEIRNKIMTTQEFTDRWRETVGEIAGVEYVRFASDFGGPGGHGMPITVELSHRDIGVLERASRELAEIISTYPLVKDVDDGFQPGKQQLDFALKPEGKSLGLTARDVARQVRNAFYGAQVLRQQRGRNEIKIMVRLPESERSTEQTIDDLLLRTPAGTDVPLREVASIDRGRAYTSISRRNGRRVIQVSADVTPRSKAGEIISDLKENDLVRLARKYRGLQYSFEGHQADISESLGSLQVTFVVALLVIYALLAIPFRSYSQPLIVMTSIPFGIVGAILGHLVMGYDLCVPSMFGIVALAGVVVNDSLVMVDFANRRLLEGGLSHHEAIHTAAIQRFRPILLTTLTTFGGLSPMIFETSRQARFLIPMALSLGYGILFATFITLVIVPSLFLVVEDFRGAFAKFRGAIAPERQFHQEPVPVKAQSMTMDS